MRILKGLVPKIRVTADPKGVTRSGPESEKSGIRYSNWELPQLDAGIYGFRIALNLYIVK